MSENDGRILEHDPARRIVERYFEDEGKAIIQNLQDAEEIIEANKALYNSTDERARHGDEVFNKVASIPMVVYMDLERRGITNDPKAFAKWLDDPENRHFRTRPGRLSR